MKVPIDRLREYVDFSLSPEALAEVFTLAGIEVEGMERAATPFSGVVVGQVLEAKQHPNADRLRVAIVTDGKEQFQVVCGAPNCRAGIKVAFAQIGACLLDEEGKPFKIKKGRLRDVESFGMLCSSAELGIDSEADQILELPADTVVGSDLSSIYGEVILDLSLTPNLGHCMSIYGLARELSGLQNLPLKPIHFTLKEEGEPIEKLIWVELLDHRQCQRYACRVIRGVNVGPSPEWLKKRIENCGMRSINNVVDVSNLVMLELGQPLHFFDYDQIAEKKVIIYSQTPFSSLTTLDSITRQIPPDVLLICDPQKPLAIAGVMGGESSAVTDRTQNILIESAYFSSQAIRKSCKWLGLKTEGAQRHDKGIDPNHVVTALNYAGLLLQQVAGGVIAPGVIDKQIGSFAPKKITCRTERVNRLLGTSLSQREIIALLQRMGMEVVEEKQHEALISVPAYRHDISIEEDLIEEVARLYGYNYIPQPTPVHISSTIPEAPLYLLESALRRRLVGEGLQEFLSCDLISPSQVAATVENTLSQAASISVLHSKSLENSVLRTTLLTGLLQGVKYNLDHFRTDVAAFEIGQIYFKDKDAYREQPTLGIILTGKRAPYHFEPKPEEFDFFDLKGIIQNLLEGFKIEGVLFTPSHLHNFHPQRQSSMHIGEKILGTLGEVHPAHNTRLGIDQRIYFAEIDLLGFLPYFSKKWSVVDSPLYPGSERDWTITVEDSVSIQSILDAIHRVAPAFLEKVSLLDLYKSEQIGKNRKNVTLRFFYRDVYKTLAFETVEREHKRITQTVEVGL